jgi:hypothetical protein
VPPHEHTERIGVAVEVGAQQSGVVPRIGLHGVHPIAR